MTSYLGDESSDTKILSTTLCIFRSDYSPEIRLGLSITILEKKTFESFRLFNMLHSRKQSTIDYGDNEIVQTLSRRFRSSDEDKNFFYILRHDDETKKTNLNFYQIDNAYRIKDIGAKCLEGVTQVDWLGRFTFSSGSFVHFFL